MNATSWRQNDDERKKKKKEAEEKRKLENERRKSDPVEKAKVWLKNLATDMQICQKTSWEMKQETGVPTKNLNEYKLLFEGHEETLTQLRSDMENVTANVIGSSFDDSAPEKVTAFKTDVDAYQKIRALYSKGK